MACRIAHAARSAAGCAPLFHLFQCLRPVGLEELGRVTRASRREDATSVVGGTRPSRHVEVVGILLEVVQHLLHGDIARRFPGCQARAACRPFRDSRRAPQSATPCGGGTREAEGGGSRPRKRRDPDRAASTSRRRRALARRAPSSSPSVGKARRLPTLSSPRLPSPGSPGSRK